MLFKFMYNVKKTFYSINIILLTLQLAIICHESLMTDFYPTQYLLIIILF